MNPWQLSSSALLIWGIALHLVADFPLQNDWMARNKAKRVNLGEFPGDGIMYAPSRMHPYTVWFLRHPAAYIHAGIQTFCLAFVFGWAAALIGLAHLIIDCRWVVVKWSQLMKQTQPSGRTIETYAAESMYTVVEPVYDMALEVRIWTDQVFHIACLMVAALLVA